jgi:sRNA-binding protein
MMKKPMSEASETLLAELRERYPKAFPAEPEAAMPLAIHIHKALIADGYARKAVAESLGLYANAPAYLAALAAGKPRVGLDGEPSGEVTAAQRELAAAQLENPGVRKAKWPAIALAGRIDNPQEPQKKKPMPQIELTAVQAKVAFTIDSETFRAVLDVDSVGAKSVLVAIAADGKKYNAQLNPKSFRKAQAAFREAANPVVSISGNLKGGAIESAGIQIFDKGAKADAAPLPGEGSPPL